MPIANPLVSTQGMRLTSGSAPAAPSGGAAAPPVGQGAMNADYNTPMHVAALGLIALGVIILLQIAGFRFVVAGRVGVG